MYIFKLSKKCPNYFANAPYSSTPHIKERLLKPGQHLASCQDGSTPFAFVVDATLSHRRSPSSHSASSSPQGPYKPPSFPTVSAAAKQPLKP